MAEKRRKFHIVTVEYGAVPRRVQNAQAALRKLRSHLSDIA
jgi:hypothetical protein